MLARPILSRILDNDAVTRGLADPEARILIEWLVERAERIADVRDVGGSTERKVEVLCRRGRALGRFVHLWCHQDERGAAVQLAAVEKFAFPFPERGADPCEVMSDILSWEAHRVEA
ncbi:MAG: hypothetical protein K2R98_27035 [Gemmataceae bacterium]|nr:hypothetical protein [Gemmataceae bacterium]